MSTHDGPIDQTRRRAAAVLIVGVGALLLAIGGRLVYVNVAIGERLVSIAQRQQESHSIIPARRGTILDSRGRVLASTQQIPDVFVDPSRVEDVDELAAQLSTRLNVPAETLIEMIRRRPGSRFVVVARAVDAVTAAAVESMDHPAVGLDQRPARTYPLNESMAHVLGWVGRDGIGLEGVELFYEKHLRGSDGRRGTIRDARRRALGRARSEPKPAIDGGSVVLTLDAEIQRIAEQALERSVERVDAESGVALVMSPRTGHVLAMAGRPTYDLNYASSAPASARRNRIITDPTEPGSTFKPFLACGALEGGFVSTTEKIDCHMGRHFFGRRLVKDTSPHGLMDLKGIIARSSNIGMGLIAGRMGNVALHDIIRRFGFGATTGIECIGESPGVVRSIDKWGTLSTQSVAMGYEVSVTPLQLITAFSAIVNDGLLLKPRLVKQLLAPSGAVVASFEEPEVVRRVVGSDVARYVAQELLVAVVEEGGGHRAKLDRYRVLGKTGTVKLTYQDRAGYEPGAYLGMFIGAAPATRPELVVLVMIRRPDATTAYYGGAVAAPAVGEILDAALSYLGIPGDRTNAGQLVTYRD